MNMRAIIGGEIGAESAARSDFGSLAGRKITCASNERSFSRIAKLFVDRDDLSLQEAAIQLSQFRVIIDCGQEVRKSATLQAALLTAANIAQRCFPGGVRVLGVESSPIVVPWAPAGGLAAAVAEIAGEQVFDPIGSEWDDSLTIALGSGAEQRRGVQMTFDGWTCAVSPLGEHVRLPEREGCILAGVAGGALAASELFMGNFGCMIEAGSRVVGLSLWRPDLAWDMPEAAGNDSPIKFLPNEIWFLGLGHLGQAVAWSFAFLPFSNPSLVNIMLQDFDLLVPANIDTSLVSQQRHIGCFKTRVVDEFLASRGFRSRLCERRFDELTRPQYAEPRIALAGMDAQGPRHLFDQANFDLVIDSGVGGTASSFDSITLNVLPNARKTAAELWPPDADGPAAREQGISRLAATRRLYREVQSRHACGHVELAGRAVAVPFVGAIASTLALSELLRRICVGSQFDRLRIQLCAPCDASTLSREKESSRFRPAFQHAQQKRGLRAGRNGGYCGNLRHRPVARRL